MSLRIENLKKKMGKFEIQASFHVGPGEILALQGRSGCGKTTLMKCILGLERIDEGQVFLNSREITHLPPEKRNCGLVSQNPSLFFQMDLIDNLTFGLKVRGRSRPERETIALQLLNQIGLSSIAKTRPEHLSGGEQRRVAFLRAICWRPEAILLDEPLTGLDQKSKDVIRAEIKNAIRQLNLPCILVSHDESDLKDLASKVIQVNETKDQRVRRFIDS